MFYTKNTILELKENCRKFFHLKRIGFFVFLYMLLNIGFRQLIDNGKPLEYPLHNFLFSLGLVLVLAIIYSVSEFLYLKRLIIKKNLRDNAFYHLGFFMLEVTIFLLYDLKIYPEIQLSNDIRPYLFGLIYSITLNISRLNFIKKQTAQ